MGCASSKQVVEAADVYHPPPASIAYFDLDTIREPWLITTATKDVDVDPEIEKRSHVPLPVLEKVDSYDEIAPKSWSEVSKALEDLKPSILENPMLTPKPQPAVPPVTKSPVAKKNQPFDTSGEVAKDGGVKTMRVAPPPPSRSASMPTALPEGLRPVSQNMFVVMDRQERERRSSTTEDPTRHWRRDPLHGFADICPPGGADSVVLYTTSVRAIRRTFDDCEMVRQTIEGYLVGEIDIDERDISLHGGYLKELRDLIGGDVSVPRLFVLGKYVGGAEEVEELNEIGRLGAIMRLVKRRRLGAGGGEAMPPPTGRKGCKGCGGTRFVPCLVCNGSCKVLVGDERSVARCAECNENGLVKCPHCN